MRWTSFDKRSARIALFGQANVAARGVHRRGTPFHARTFALLTNPANPLLVEAETSEQENAAHKFGVEIQKLLATTAAEVAQSDDIAASFLRRAPVEGAGENDGSLRR